MGTDLAGKLYRGREICIPDSELLGKRKLLNDFKMIIREKRHLLGLVRSVEAEFAVFEIIDGNAVETRHQSAGFEFYDLEGKLIEEISPERLMMEDSYKDIYTYNAEGELILRDEYEEDGKLRGKTIFERDENGNRVEKNYYFDNYGILRLGIHTIYDPEDNHLETAHYDENEQVIPRHIYKAGSQSLRKVEETIIYKDDGHIIESSHYDEKGKLTHKTVTSFDLRGNRMEFSSYQLDGMLVQKTRNDYDYDSVGNWTKRLEYWWTIGWGELHLIPWTVVRRKIDYY